MAFESVKWTLVIWMLLQRWIWEGGRKAMAPKRHRHTPRSPSSTPGWGATVGSTDKVPHQIPRTTAVLPRAPSSSHDGAVATGSTCKVINHTEEAPL